MARDNKDRNKLWRRNKEVSNWVRRTKVFNAFKHGKPEDYSYCWKAQGTPCSCNMCNRNLTEKPKYKEKYKSNYKLNNDEN